MKISGRLSYILGAMVILSLVACGGGGDGSTLSPPIPIPEPKPKYSVGPFAINGIDRIPQSMVKLTREEMQRKFVIAGGTEFHEQRVGEIFCKSYIQSGDCDSQTGKFRSLDGTITAETGSAPFTKLVAESRGIAEQEKAARQWLMSEIAKMPEVKIANYSRSGSSAPAAIGNGDLPYLVIHGTGNGAGNAPWYDDLVSAANKVKVEKAITENRLIFVGGYDRDANGNYVRHRLSDSCRGEGIREGCIWTQFQFPVYGGGVSWSTPQFSAALASVLAITPDTTPQNLARFGKACVKKSGEGIEELLRISGGLGVADFACVGDVVTALANLPSGGTTNLSINGQPVTLSGRRITLSFAGGLGGIPMETDGFFFNAVPSTDKRFLLVAGYRKEALFTALSLGIRNDFFGFDKEHRNIREAGVAAGHENLFLALTEQRSDGGNSIAEAVGRSLNVTARKTFALTEGTSLTVTALADRFLGGRATIPLGTIDLGRGRWSHRFSVASETDLTSGMSFRTKAEMIGDENYAFSAGIRLTF